MRHVFVLDVKIRLRSKQDNICVPLMRFALENMRSFARAKIQPCPQSSPMTCSAISDFEMQEACPNNETTSAKPGLHLAYTPYFDAASHGRNNPRLPSIMLTIHILYTSSTHFNQHLCVYNKPLDSAPTVVFYDVSLDLFVE